MIDRLVLVQWVALAVSEERSLAPPVAPVMGGFVPLAWLPHAALVLVRTSLHLFHLLVVMILGVVSLGFC